VLRERESTRESVRAHRTVALVELVVARATVKAHRVAVTHAQLQAVVLLTFSNSRRPGS
jgi:hypothetical protein